jgi:hypothetical protein
MSELVGYQLAFVITYSGFMLLGGAFVYNEYWLKRLRKNGTLTTKKGTYTFTPAKEQVQDV